ncbi:PREDICTED: protein aubergine-like [Dinoponera quadriceps]|uniref:Protein aubergine-like n=1 Tax=Dinoponera quadriceps TaxID=609295 RepID=A0A6P3XBZ9_DINQU|nr:PREDICTED: protein aubergine-like [Dinoponera quadriceps]
MSEKGRGKSRGRAISQQRAQQLPQQQLPHAQASTSQEVRRPGQIVAQAVSSSGGRGVATRVGAKGDGAGAQIGRGIEKMSIQPSASGDAGSSVGALTTVSTTGRGASRGKRMVSTDIFVTKPSHIMNKKGNTGSIVNLKTNYFKFITKPDWCIYLYRVDFAPEEDRTVIRKGLLKPHKEKLGVYIFDGTVLYTSNRLPEKMELMSIRQSDNAKIKIDVRVVSSIMQSDPHYLQFFNTIMRKCLGHLKLQLVGRNYFDAENKVSLPEHRLELWPGYLTSIRQHECDVLMCAEITTKVMRQETLLDILNDCWTRDNHKFRANFVSMVVGSIVLTAYNNNTYRVEDVDYNANPKSTFPMKDGTMVSYVDYYYNKYGLRITNATQPMLLSRSKTRDRQADKGDRCCYLVPELCRATGLTDAMRDNFSVMSSLSTYTRINPEARIEKLLSFSRRLREHPDAKKEFDHWNMKLDNNLLELKGRILHHESIIFGGNPPGTVKSPVGDWGREMQNKRCLVVKELRDWILIVSERERRSIQNFVDILLKVSHGISFRVEQPRIFTIRDDRPSSYSEFLEGILSKQIPQLIFCVVPNNRMDRYSAIKKKCCVDRPVPSQVYLQKNLSHRNVLSIATKVAIQMNCKLGGAPWRVDIPIEGLMTIGFDVCHDTTKPGKDYGAMVASLNKDFTKYYSSTDLHADGNELSHMFTSNIYKAAMAYRAQNNSLPSRILVYRDGVGEGQVPHVIEREVVDLRQKLNELYGGEHYKMSFVIVTKRINTRFFHNKGNPPPGTVVDDVVTSPIKYDFFLVSQKVKQGTVSPTSYSVVYDNIGLDPDRMQRITYKLTHMYFNCSNTVRVPAPCHYAHKLAFLVSKFIHQSPDSQLENTLFFL